MKYVVKILTEHRDRLNEKYVQQNTKGQPQRMETLDKVMQINHALDLLKLVEVFEATVNARLVAQLAKAGWRRPPQCKE